jgi:predicted outer membrane repeat protein
VSRRARLRLAAAALIALVAGVVLATGRLTGTFALFTAETENQASTFSGDWVAAPTGLGAPSTPAGLGATLTWTHATHGVTGQEIWYAHNGTTANCTAVTYAGLVTGGSLSATANTITGSSSPNDQVSSAYNGEELCYQIRSTHNTWYTAANFSVIQVGFVPTGVSYTGAGKISSGSTITITFNQNVSYSGGAITVCTFTSGTILIGDTGCAGAGDTPTIGKLVGGTVSKTTTCATSTVGTSGTSLTITLANCPNGVGNQASVSGTAAYTGAGTTAESTTSSVPQCTLSTCKPNLTY